MHFENFQFFDAAGRFQAHQIAFARFDQGAAQPIREIVPYQMILPREDLTFRRTATIARRSFRPVFLAAD